MKRSILRITSYMGIWAKYQTIQQYSYKQIFWNKHKGYNKEIKDCCIDIMAAFMD